MPNTENRNKFTAACTSGQVKASAAGIRIRKVIYVVWGRPICRYAKLDWKLSHAEWR